MTDYNVGAVLFLPQGNTVTVPWDTFYNTGSVPVLPFNMGAEPLDPVYDAGQVTDLLKTGGGTSVSFRTIPKLTRSIP